VEFVDMGGFELEDAGWTAMNALWVRGGFPLSFLAENDENSLAWRTGFVRTFLERDLGRFGIGAPPEAIGRLWKMLAHYHGGVWNASEFGRSLGVTSQTSRRHLDILAQSFMVRALPPWFENMGKRLVRHPKVYLRDSGILHTLLGLAGLDDVRGHPKCGASWEGFCIEQILTLTGDRDAYFWATHAGAELDLLLVRGRHRIGFEFKYADGPRRSKSMETARADLRLTQLNVVYPGSASYPLGDGIEVVSLPQMLQRIRGSPQIGR
jgi:uncharacterized protein